MNKISEKKIIEIIEDLKKYKSLNNKKHKANYYYQARQNIIDSDHKIELIKEFLDIYSQCKRNITTKELVETDDKAVTNIERDEEGRIQFYTFEIFRKNSPTLRGKLDRKEMEIIFDLYTTYGQNLTAKIVSRNFPEYSFIEFKRILRAFNIYKSSGFPQHLIEELSEEELIARSHRQKETKVMRSLEKDELTQYKKLVNKLASKIQSYESKGSFAKELLGLNIDNNPYSIFQNFTEDDTLVLLLSDCHVGAYNEPNGYLKLENYNESEIWRRLVKTFDVINYNKYKNIIVLNLGDSVDSYNKETTRGGHELPTIISNKEQSKLYLKIMYNYFNTIKNSIKNANIYYYCVGESNHDGDWGWINNIVLSERLKELGITSYISDNPIDYININNTSIVYLHGKNNVDQFRGFPLTLNKQTESWFNDFFVDCDFDLKKNKVIVKGDLHQFAVTEGHNFQYISAPSLYGSSQYIVSNFGKTNWGIGYLEISDNNIKIGKISD